MYYYSHFFTNTVHTLAISQCLDSKFWHRAFEGPSQDVPCVRHAVIALGVTHWSFIAPGNQALHLEKFAVGQYNHAISELMKCTRIAHTASDHLHTVLTCCFLFLLIETLRGNYSEAFCHLESGSNIIIDTQTSGQPPDPVVAELAAMFHAISSQVSLFSDGRIFPDLTSSMAPMKKYKEPAATFRDLDEAEDVMNCFDDHLTHICWDLPQDWEDDDSEVNKQWNILTKQIEAWKPHFEGILKDFPADRPNSQQRKRVVNLKVQHKIWELLIDQDPCTDDDIEQRSDERERQKLSAEECNTLLDEMECLWGNTNQPQFGLKVDLITANFQLYAYCPDITVRRRIISILRSRRRREIAFDSRQLADFLELDLERRQAGLQKLMWPDVGPSPNDDTMLVYRPRNTAN